MKLTVRSLVALAVMLLAFSFVPTTALAGGGDINFLYGMKDIDLDLPAGSPPELDDLEDQDALGILFNFGKEDWPISIAVDIISSDESTAISYSYYYYPYGTYTYRYAIKLDIAELDLGVRKFWGENRVQGYVGGGAAVIQTDAKLSFTISGPGGTTTVSQTDDTTEIGYFINAGVRVKVGKAVQLGLDVRHSDAEAELFGDPDGIEVGGLTYGGFLGFRFGQN